MKILVVEDDKLIRESYAETLRLSGHYVETAQDGAEGLAHINGHKFDVIVVDVVMPRMGGLEFLVDARKKGETAAAVVVTGFDPIHCAGLDGIVTVLQKPVRGPDLLKAVQEGSIASDAAIIAALVMQLAVVAKELADLRAADEAKKTSEGR